MVAALHAADIEVILDVVFNHTCEGGAGRADAVAAAASTRPATTCTRRRGRTLDITGCGNTLDAGSPAVRAAGHDSLRYWATEMGVDGFRFDLAIDAGQAARRRLRPVSRRCSPRSPRTRCCRGAS